MMYSTIAFVALSGLYGTANEADATRWTQDYSVARETGRSEKKPLLVVVGSGSEGWGKLAKSGKMGKEANEILSESYVCVYADISTTEGWRLARALGMTNGLGVVISDRTGQHMAFFHEGNLADETLTRYLQRYADPNRVFTATETNPNGTLHTYQPSSGATFSRSC